MTDSQNQAISSAWIGKRVCVKKDEKELYGTLQYFGEIIIADGNWCGIELDESLGENDGKIGNERYFVCKENHGIFVPASEREQLQCKILLSNFSYSFIELNSQTPLKLNEEQHFSFNLPVKDNSKEEITNTCFNATMDLGPNKTFNVSLRNDNRKEISVENQISADMLDKKINSPTLKSNCSFEKQVPARLDSEESLGIISDVLDDFNGTWDVLGSCSTFLNQYNGNNYKTETRNIAIFKEPSPQNLDFCDFNRLCFENNSPVQNCVNEEIYTSTPMHPLKNINLDFSVVFPQNHSFLLNDEIKVDEPILAGSSQTVTKISFDDEEFDRGKILSSTSKLSSVLQVHQNIMKKTFNFNDETDLNIRQTFSENPLETSNVFEKFDGSRALQDVDILNTTFQIKRTVSSPAVFPDENLAVSPILTANCLNKHMSMNDLTSVAEEEEDTIKNSKFDILSSPNEWNKTKVLCSPLNNISLKISEIEAFESQNEFNQCSDSASGTVSLRRASLDSKNFSTKSICLNSSANSLNASKSANSIFKLNTTFSIKNDESQSKLFAAKHFNKRCSLSAVPVLSQANSFQKHLPVSSKLGCLPKSEPNSSISKTISIDAKRPKTFIKSTSTCLPKSVKAKPSKKNKTACNNIDAFKHTAIQSKKMEINEAKLKNTTSIQTKTDIGPSINGASIKHNDVSKHLTISQSENTLNSQDRTSDNDLKIKNCTFSASEFQEESVAVNEWGKWEMSDQISDKSINTPAKQFEEGLINKLGTEAVNLTSTKRDNFVTNLLDKTVHISYSCEGNLKDVSQNSTPEINIDLNASLQCVKSIPSKPIVKPKLSFVPTFKPSIHSRNNMCTSIQFENELQDSSKISSKLYSRKSIQVPRFHLKPSTGIIKEPMRSQGKALQKENIDVNSRGSIHQIPSGKNTKLGNKQSNHNGKFCQNKTVMPIKEKVSKTSTIAMNKKDLNAFELKPDQSSKIPSFGGGQQTFQSRLPAPRSYHGK